MRKIIFVIAMIAIVASVSLLPSQAAYSQKKSSLDSPYDILLQDDETGSYLRFSSLTGHYEIVRCSDGYKMSGIGIVQGNGCDLTLTDIAEDHKVMATLDMCAHEGKAYCEQVEGKETPEMNDYFKDEDMHDNVARCNKNVR